MVLNDKKKSIEFFTSELIIFFPIFYDIYLIRFNKISRFYVDNFIHNIIYSIKRLHIIFIVIMNAITQTYRIKVSNLNILYMDMLL